MSLPTLLRFAILLVSLSSFLPSLCAQPPPPPPPPSPGFYEPDAAFHGWATQGYALDPRGNYILVIDHHTFLHSVDLRDPRQRREQLYTDPAFGLEAVAITRRGLPVVATVRKQLLYFDEQWRPAFNVSLGAIDRRVEYWVAGGQMLVDSNDYLYLLGSNGTGSYFVNILDSAGVRRDSWMIPGRLTFPNFPVWCNDKANNVYLIQSLGPPNRPLQVFTSGGVPTDTLRTDLSFVDGIDAIAVAPNGNIVLAGSGGQLGPTLFIYDAQFRPLFRYPLSAVADSVSQLTFDVFGNLWCLDTAQEMVLALAPNGDLLMTVASDVPSLYALTSLQYDRSTDTLLFTDLRSQPFGLQRIDSRDGRLLQSYTLPSRLASCEQRALQVTGDGNAWLLLHCRDDPSIPPTRVHVLNRSGRVQRELLFPDAGEAVDLALDPYDARLFITWAVGVYPALAVDVIRAYALDGRPLFNVSTLSPSPPVMDVQATSLAFHSLCVLERGQSRLTFYSIADGSLQGTAPLPPGVTPTALLADREGGFFLAHYDLARDGGRGRWNSSVLQFNATGGLMGQYVLGPYTGGAVFARLVVDEEGDRLFALDDVYGVLARWRIRRRASAEAEEAVVVVEPERRIQSARKGQRHGGSLGAK